MSVCASSLVPTAVDQSRLPAGELAAVPRDLLVVLEALIDPRARRGVRHRLVSLLGVAVCAVLTRARSYAAVAEWTADLPLTVRRRLELGRPVPSESTIRRVLQRVDADLLDRLVSGWLAGQTPTAPGRRQIAVDGKTVRGARARGGRAVHLLAAFDTASGIVLGQSVVAGKTSKPPSRCAAPRMVENVSWPAWSTPMDLGAGESVNELGAGASGRRPGLLPVSTRARFFG